MKTACCTLPFFTHLFSADPGTNAGPKLFARIFLSDTENSSNNLTDALSLLTPSLWLAQNHYVCIVIFLWMMIFLLLLHIHQRMGLTAELAFVSLLNDNVMHLATTTGTWYLYDTGSLYFYCRVYCTCHTKECNGGVGLTVPGRSGQGRERERS